MTSVLNRDTVVITQPPKMVIPVLGARGPMGPVGAIDPAQFYQATNLLSELNTEQKKAEARANLGISSVDSITVTAPFAISSNRAVCFENGVLAYAQKTNANEILGFTTGATSANVSVTIQTSGELDGFFNLTTGLPIYLSSDGTITQTVPTTGRLQTLGIALSSTKVLIQIQIPMYLATIAQNGYFNNDYVDAGYVV